MRYSYIVISAAILLANSAPSFADPASQTPQMTQAPGATMSTVATQPTQTAATGSGESAVNPDEIVCRTMDPPTGTRLGARRVCQTQREWQQQETQAQQEIERGQRMGSTANTPSH